MTFYTDLTPCDYLPIVPEEKLLAVGWLAAEVPFSSGAVTTNLIETLDKLLKNPWQPFLLAGPHICNFCPAVGNGIGRAGGVNNLFVPGDGVVYLAPELIRHYILIHGYAPPPVFQDAAMTGPPMGSMAYREALIKNGPSELVALVREAMR